MLSEKVKNAFKVGFSALLLTSFISFSSPAHANSIENDGMNQVDTSFEDTLMNEVRKMRSDGATDKEIKKYFMKNGVTVASIGKSVFDRNGNEITVNENDVNTYAVDQKYYIVGMYGQHIMIETEQDGRSIRSYQELIQKSIQGHKIY